MKPKVKILRRWQNCVIAQNRVWLVRNGVIKEIRLISAEPSELEDGSIIVKCLLDGDEETFISYSGVVAHATTSELSGEPILVLDKHTAELYAEQIEQTVERYKKLKTARDAANRDFVSALNHFEELVEGLK